MRRTIRQTLAATSTLALLLGVTACGEGEASETDTDADAITETNESDVTVDSIVGLEVTAVGNISEILSNEAVRIDRDGLGTAQEQGDVESDAYDYDYDYYDYDDLTAYDEDFGDADIADEGVLVVSSTGLEARSVDQEIRVSGTIRRFDQDTIESVYDIDLETDTYDDYEDALVIVADSIKKPSAPGADGSTPNSGASASPNESG